MDSLERTQLIHDLDTKYHQISHQTELLVRDEESRRMKLRSMVIRDEASSLKDQISKRDARIKALNEQVDDARAQLDSVQDRCRRQEKLMQTQSREISSLKAEMSSLGSASQDSAKILSEKLALSRELAVLKPETEHLRSQLVHQKDVLADKLALERQLNALEVELANEKRAAQKAARKQDQESQEEAELRKRVQELEKQLAKEKKAAQKNKQNQENKNSEAEDELESLRERLAGAESSLATEKRKRGTLQEQVEQLRQAAEDAEKALAAEKRAAQRKAKSDDGKASAAEDEIAEMRGKLAEVEKALAEEKKSKAQLQKEHEQAVAEAETRQQAMDAKLEKLRSKLRETQEELKLCRSDLESARDQRVTIPKVTTTTVPLKRPAAKAPAKKKAAPLEEAILQTPGQDDRPKRPLKKRGFDPSAVEKSTFSITPFLNKTINLSDESLKTNGDDTTRTVPALQFSGDEAITTAATTVDEPTAAELLAQAPARTAAKKHRVQLKSKPLADAAPSKKNLTARGLRGKALLPEPVLEKVAEEPDEPDEPEQDQENRSMESTATAKSVEAEAEPKKKKRKLLGASNKPSLFDEDEGERVMAKRPPKTALGGARTKVTMGSGTRNAFAGASFSPLKRDRRGVGASFLA